MTRWLLLMLLLPAGLWAAERPKLKVDARVLQAFQLQAESVRVGMSAGQRYEFVSAEERAKVEAALLEIEAVLAEQAPGQALDRHDATRIQAAEAVVNGILKLRDGDQRICERSRPTGSNIGTTRCQTSAEREYLRRAAQRAVRDLPASQNALGPDR